MRLFIVGAIVLIVLGIIASATDSGQTLGVWWYTWFMASFLSFLVDILLGGFGYGVLNINPNRARQPQ